MNRLKWLTHLFILSGERDWVLQCKQRRWGPMVDRYYSILHESTGDRNRKSCVHLDTQICLCWTYIVPVLMCGSDSWATTKYLCAWLDAFNTLAVDRILHVPDTCHIGYYCSLFTCANWRRPPGRQCHTWLRAVEDDLKPLNFGLVIAWRKTANRFEMIDMFLCPDTTALKSWVC